MRKRRKRETRVRERKGIYLLPNLLTSASLFGGFYAVIASMHGRYEAASIAILISCIFDGLDGRVARLTHTTSRFGTEYDSLSDLIAFGVAPGILAYKWALEPFGRLGWLAAFIFVVCGALRLARFNVQSGSVDANFFRGLPIPAAAAFVSSMVLFSSMTGFPQKVPILIIITIYMLSFLMVSTIRYLTFKELDLKKRKPFHVLVAIILVMVVIASKPKILLFIIGIAYVLSGPVVTLYRHQRRRSRINNMEEEVYGGKQDEKDNQEMSRDGDAERPQTRAT